MKINDIRICKVLLNRANNKLDFFSDRNKLNNALYQFREQIDRKMDAKIDIMEWI